MASGRRGPVHSSGILGWTGQRQGWRKAFCRQTLHLLALGAWGGEGAAVAAAVARAGLGAVSAADETAIFRQCVAHSRERFAEMGITLPSIAHPRLGSM